MERLTDAELEGWYHQLDHIGCMDRIPAKQVLADLRALRAAVRAMPEPREWHAGLHWCPACKGGTTSMHTTPVTHAPDCPWAVARALAGEEGAE